MIISSSNRHKSLHFKNQFILYNVQHMDKKILTISITAIVGFVLVSYLAFNKPTQTSFPEQAQTREKSDKVDVGDHKKGTGKNILIEYSDLQCPACKMFHDYIEAEKVKDKEFAKFMDTEFTFIYRHFPLTNIHKNAEAAAYAAEAAARQGKFYEFIDQAFATQEKWSDMDKPMEFFQKIALDMGIGDKQFLEDASSDVVKNKVQSDSELALKGQVDSTPTFFSNGVKLTGFGTFEEFKKLLIDSVAKK